MKKQKKVSIRVKLISMTIAPLLILAIVVTTYAITSLRSGMQEEAFLGLKDLCYSLSSMYTALDDGEYRMEGDKLMKGDFPVTDDEKALDRLCKESHSELTLFYGDTRRATTLKDAKTGERIIGTKASAEVTDLVVKQKQEYSSSDSIINNEHYYAYYIPMENPDGSIVGMIFAGKPTADVDATIATKAMAIIGICIGIFIIVGIIVLIIATKMGKAIAQAENAVEKLANGDLTTVIDVKMANRRDEIGAMGKALAKLTDKLRDVIGQVKNSADTLLTAGEDLHELATHTEVTANEISHAVDDVSHGAVSQAEDIENATLSVGEMGTTIEMIVSKVDNLNKTSDDMKTAGDDASKIIVELSDASEKTFEAIKLIEKQVYLTDDSVNKIKEAVTLIASIAEETNLLSLNASIEAARAGEAGKGFAVVASEIQKLADESNKSATTIAEVINVLSSESQNTVHAVNEMAGIMKETQEKLKDTQTQFNGVSKGIESSHIEISDIKEESEVCDQARVKVIDVIQNLSAVSEENAAATEETMASMQELNATIDTMAEKSTNLRRLAEDLEQDMRYFKL